MTEKFHILVVCVGNICRSPLAERLLQAGLDQQATQAFEVSSAGTNALVGHEMDSRARRILRDNRGQLHGFKSRQLTSRVLDGQDLVLSMDRSQKSQVLELRPELLDKSFTIREFARVIKRLDHKQIDEEATTDSKNRWIQIVRKAFETRGEALPGYAHDDEVVDPYRQANEVYDEMAAQLLPAISSILQLERRGSVTE